MSPPRFRILATTLLLAAALGVPGGMHTVAAEELSRQQALALRRTPAVTIFQRWKGSVVFVTGPTANPQARSLSEFFRLPGKRLDNAIGGGFVIHESGYVVTNAHAVENVIQDQIGLVDGRQYAAELIALSPETDLALVKFHPSAPLKPVRLAQSDDVLVGEPVVVIGHPHGLRYTCTTGVVSGVGRATNLEDRGGRKLRDLLQSDAGINPGSSGGPWFNAAGEVIGLTASMKRNSENIAFAISAATIRKTLPDLLDVERRDGLTTGLTVAADGPARVVAVAPDSPAARAEIRPGDVIVALAGRPTPSVLDYHLALVDRSPGDRLAVKLDRKSVV